MVTDDKAVRYVTENWKTTTQRFVVVLDIMGFKDQVARTTHSDVYNTLLGVSQTIQISLPNDDSVFITQFSDSVFVFSKDDSCESLVQILISVSGLIRSLIEQGIPIRGAMALGELSVNEPQQIYFGQPLIDAYLLEETEIEYYGVVMHHSMDKKCIELEQKDYLIECKTFLKNVGKVYHYNLNWSYDIITKTCFKCDAEKNLTNIRLRVSGKPRKYIDNTLEMLKLFGEPCK